MARRLPALRPLTRLALACAAAACDGGTEGLPLGPPSGTNPDAGVTPSACAEVERDTSAEDHLALLRLGLALSPTVLQGRLEAPAGDGRQARLTVSRVERGHGFLLGTSALVEVDRAFLAATPLPAEVLVGLSEPGLPSRGLEDAPTLGAAVVTLPAARRTEVTDQLGYPGLAPPFVAVVEVAARDEDRATLRVQEVLTGEVPEVVHVNWGRAYAAPWPEVGPARYLASFSYLSFNEPSGVYLGTLADWRAAAPEALAAARATLARPRAPVDGPALVALRQRLSAAWTFRRAPRVLQTRVTGLAGECCTGAGGTYVAHEIMQDLRGDAEPGPFQTGGHAYYPEEGCGDRMLLATDGPLRAPVPGDAFTCTGDSGVEGYLETTRERARLTDDDRALADVRGWLAATPPLYHARAADAPPGDPIPVGLDAPWSRRRSPSEALSFGTLAHVEVVAAEPLGAGHRIVLATNLSPYPTSSWPTLQLQLTPACADPRLQEVGSSWLLPFVADPSEPGSPAEAALAGAVFFPRGVILEADGPAERIMYALQAALR
jgi:hypothetical protein